MSNPPFVISTPTGVFTFPPQETGWGAATIAVSAKARNTKQKAPGKTQSKTKQNGAEPLEVQITLDFVRSVYEDGGDYPSVKEMLWAIHPNGPNGSGPFDFDYWKFVNAGGKAIVIDEHGDITERGDHLTCVIKAHQWVAEPETVGTKEPNKSSELGPGAGYYNARGTPPATVNIERAQKAQSGIAQAFFYTIAAHPVAARGFDGPNAPKVAP